MSDGTQVLLWLLVWGLCFLGGWLLSQWLKRKKWMDHGYEDARLPYRSKFRLVSLPLLQYYYNKGYRLGLEQNERERNEQEKS